MTISIHLFVITGNLVLLFKKKGKERTESDKCLYSNTILSKIKDNCALTTKRLVIDYYQGVRFNQGAILFYHKLNRFYQPIPQVLF